MLIPLAALAAAAALILAWAARLIWLSRQPAAPGPAGPPPDPHGPAVAEFRRQLHDWDRGRGLG